MPGALAPITLLQHFEGMTMKISRILLACAFALSFAVPAAAQEKSPQELTAAEWRARIQADKKGIVERGMNLTAAEAKKFWPLYEGFQRELAVPLRERTRAVVDFVAAESTMTDANAKRLAEQVLAASLEEARLQQKHFRRLLGVLPAKKAARYMQIENKIQAVLSYDTARAIPLIP
jgi:Spy/CpxP family protein refolding chaperone